MYWTQKTGNMEQTLDIKNLCVVRTDGTQIFPVVNNIIFSIEKGDFFCLVGESGSGKTTLALSIMRLLPRSFKILSGNIILCGKEITAVDEKTIRSVRGKLVSMIFQDPGAYLDPVFNINQHLQESFHGNWPEFQELRIKALKEVGLDVEILQSYPHQLSGGQQQRVLIAMALINNPSLIIADEPTTALDAITTKQIMALLNRIRLEHNPAMLFITHDLNLALNVGTRIGIMYRGYIIEIFNPHRENPRHPYAKTLLGYIEEKQTNGNFNADFVDSFSQRETCVFFDRCPERKPACAKKIPFRWYDEKTGIRCIKYE